MLIRRSGQGELTARPKALPEGMAAALYWLGYDPNTTDEGELEVASDPSEPVEVVDRR